jgi:predicted XRE-type DNA-binding protein
MKLKENQNIRNMIKANGVYQWQVSEALDVSEVTLVRWMRMPLDDQKKEMVISGIEKAKQMFL